MKLRKLLLNETELDVLTAIIFSANAKDALEMYNSAPNNNEDMEPLSFDQITLAMSRLGGKVFELGGLPDGSEG